MRVQMATATPRMKRKMRSPQHPFNIVAQPWQVQPMFIAPVLPGETMKNLMLMSRVVSDPLKEKLMGWWCEYYFFYVKHSDLPIAQDLIGMHLNPNANLTALSSAGSVPHFHAGGINFVEHCLDSVLKWYFRDENDAAEHLIAGMPSAKINHDGWWQSAKLASELPQNDHELPGDNPTYPQGAPPGMESQFAQWEAMRAAQLTTATFEDYLMSFGVRAEKNHDEEEKRPELIRYSKQFTYPTNTVEPTTGEPSSAAVWSISERADKDRYFKEPGFLFGVQVVRPKVMLSNITGTLTSFMDHAFNWLPALLADLPFTSLEDFAAASGPAPGAYGEDYWVDVKDLFIYGEQFRNHNGQMSKVALPDATMNHEYPSTADAEGLFVDAVKKFFRTDGLVSLNVASSAYKDTSG